MLSDAPLFNVATRPAVVTDAALKIAVWRHRLRIVGAATAAATVLGASVAAGADRNHNHIMIQPDELQWRAAPLSLPPGAKFVLMEGDPAKAVPLTMRLRFPAGYRIPPHTHPAIEHITVLSGTFHMGAGETFDERKGKRLSAGSFAVMPANASHYAWASEDTVVQLHSVGPWGVTYVNAADDPRSTQ